MVLTYKGAYRLEATNPRGMCLVEESETKIWGVGRNPDGSVDLVMRHGVRSASGRDGKEPVLDGKSMDYGFDRFALFPDGRLGLDPEIVFLIPRMRPEALFPRLPEDRARADAGWFAPDEEGPGGTRFEPLRAEPGGWTFRGFDEGPGNSVSGATIGSTFHFDSDRGLVKRIESEETIHFGTHGKGVASEEMVSLETLDDHELAAFVQEAKAFFATYKSGHGEGERDPEKLEAILNSAKAELIKTRDAMTEPTFREALDRRVKRFDYSVDRAIDDARRRAEFVGKPAVGWKAPGLDGREHDLADYRGKVVVLDFWYRGCVPCVKAMPQINEVAERFADKPVAVLGMNTDPVEADAKLVADVMGLKYDTILVDRDLSTKYGVRAFPTTIVIDPDGVVRDVHVGYSKNLRDSLVKSIEALLPK